MFKMAKKPMYRLKNGPQNLQHRNIETTKVGLILKIFDVSAFVGKPSVVNFT